MADEPKFAVVFRRKGDTEPMEPAEPKPEPVPEGRTEVYHLALELASKVFTVVELAEVERYFLRDQLDRKSTAIPVAIAHGLATADMAERRDLYRRARAALTDCMTVLDVLSQRGTVEPQAIETARTVARQLADKLDSLTIPPPMTR